MNNGHYLNTGTDTVMGHTRVLIRTVPRNQVRFATINALPGNNQISVPPGETRTIEQTWAPPRTARAESAFVFLERRPSAGSRRRSQRHLSQGPQIPL